MKENCKPCCSKNKASKKGLHLLSKQCLKIIEKVSFTIAGEASYVYILFKFAKNSQFCEFLKS